MTQAQVSDGRGVIPVLELYSVSKIRGQHRAKPHSDRCAKAGQQWGRHSIAETAEASSRLTREPIMINVPGPVDRCPDCLDFPTWDREGNLACQCKIWSDAPTKPPREDPDSVNERALRNQKYQKDMRRFFKKGRA